MDSKIKTALAVGIGVVIGMTLLGGAIAIPAAFHAVAVQADGAGGERVGPMGLRQGPMGQSQGMMGQSRGMMGQSQGMMGRGQGRGQVGPQDGNQQCPEGVDPGTCPGCSSSPTTGS